MAPRRERMHLIQPNRRSAPAVVLDFEWSGVRNTSDDLHFERGTTITGDPVLLLSPASEQGHAALRTEIETGIQLARTFDESAYPAQLSRLVGYDAPHRPAAVVVTCVGEPLTAGVVEAIPTRDLPKLAESLLTALRLLVDARIVHRAVVPERLFWNGDTMQITGFRNAVPALPPVRRGDGLAFPPWTSPEQLAGEGQVSPHDDLYGATAILWWLYTRELPGPAATMPARLDLQSEDLKQRMAGMFAASAEDRPTLAEVQRRWRPVIRTSPRTPASEHAEREAARAFADLRRRQHAERAVPLATAPMFREDLLVRADPALSRGGLVAAGALLVLVLAVAVIALTQVG